MDGDPKPATWRAQYAALCWKHYLIARRNWRTSAAQVLMGVVVTLLLLVFQLLANGLLGYEIAHPPPVRIGPPPQCVPLQHSTRVNADGSLASGACNTVLYAPQARDVRSLLQRVAANNDGLQYERDFVAVPGASSGPPFDLHLVNVTLTNAAMERAIVAGQPTWANLTCIVGNCSSKPVLGECLPCDAVRDNATMNTWLARHPNSTQNGLWFFGAYVDTPEPPPPLATDRYGSASGIKPPPVSISDLSYSILYNFSATQFPTFGKAYALELQRALQQALLELAIERRHNSTVTRPHDAAETGLRVSFNYTVQQRSFPRPPPRIAGYDVFADNGGQWLFVVPALSFFNVLVELVYEKEAKLR